MNQRFEYIGNLDYRLTSSLHLNDRGFRMRVPRGFIFNVSIPLPLRWLLSPHDHRFLEAAALHDYALHELRWPREMAAAPFGQSLRRARVGRVRRLFMVLGVIMWKWQ